VRLLGSSFLGSSFLTSAFFSTGLAGAYDPPPTEKNDSTFFPLRALRLLFRKLP
jgi:hypothetical protein